MVEEDGTGSNENYYLYSGILYRLVSPHIMLKDLHVAMLAVNASGIILHHWSERTGGVLYFLFL